MILRPTNIQRNTLSLADARRGQLMNTAPGGAARHPATRWVTVTVDDPPSERKPHPG